MPFIPVFTIIRLLFRYRWARLAFVPVTAAALTLGGVLVIGRAHPAHPVPVNGDLLHYYIQSRYLVETGRDVVISQEPTHRYHLIGSYAPQLPDRLVAQSRVTLYVDEGTDDVVGISATNAQTGATYTYRTPYLSNPDQLRDDRLIGGLGMLLVPLALVAFVGYAAFIYKPPTKENQARKAEAAAQVDYGPMSPHVAGFLRALSRMSEPDWKQVAHMCMSEQLSGAPRATQQAALRLRAAAATAGRTKAIQAAHEAAERIVRAHPPVKDITGMDMRSHMATPAGRAVAAVAAGDLVSREDFSALYDMMQPYIPAESLVAPAPVMPDVVAPPATPGEQAMAAPAT